jgi:hypothetical protein
MRHAGPAIGGQATHQRRGAADCAQCRQAEPESIWTAPMIRRLFTFICNFWNHSMTKANLPTQPSPASKTRVSNSAEFKTQVVDQDYAEYKRDPTNLRLAYHLAVSLFHLRDWTFAEHSGTAKWPYGPTVGHYQQALEGNYNDFGYMRDLANAVKHKELDQSKRPSTQMVGLANTEVSMASFQPGAFQSNAFQTRTYIVSETAPAQHVDFEKAADAVMDMWNKLFAAHNWL